MEFTVFYLFFMLYFKLIRGESKEKVVDTDDRVKNCSICNRLSRSSYSLLFCYVNICIEMISIKLKSLLLISGHQQVVL